MYWMEDVGTGYILKQVDWIRTEADCTAETQAVVFVSGIPTTSTPVYRDNSKDCM